MFLLDNVERLVYTAMDTKVANLQMARSGHYSGHFFVQLYERGN
jgi:hypothetical protein